MTAYKDGNNHIQCYECDLAKVIAILPKGGSIPLKDWGRIFQWLGAAPQGKWKVIWLGSTTVRSLPENGDPLSPAHLNGGYTHACSTNGIIIYRIEEATRVLIHELLHAACLDEAGLDIPMKEAHIEAWAELFLVAHRAGGNPAKAAKLWNLQSHWIVDTNHKAKKEHNVNDPSDYGWRYLNGREGVFASLGVALPAPKLTGEKSSRFTHPALDRPVD
jgi:hypothetical protein